MPPALAMSSASWSCSGIFAPLHAAVGFQLHDRVLIFQRRDLGRDFIEFGDQFDGSVLVGAHERERAIERIQRLLHHLRLVLHVFVERDPAGGEIRRHFLGEVEDAARFARFGDLEAQRRIDHRRIDIAGEQVRHQPAAADRHAGELDLLVLLGPQRQQVGAGACGGDRDLLAFQIADAERRFRKRHQLPAVIAHGGVGEHFGIHALLASGRHQRGGVENDVGGACCHRFKSLGAAAIDRQFGRDAFLLEQFLAHRGFRDRGRPIGFCRKADADGVGGLRDGRCAKQGGCRYRCQYVTSCDAHCDVSLCFFLIGLVFERSIRRCRHLRTFSV